jgi:hypothetical protein
MAAKKDTPKVYADAPPMLNCSSYLDHGSDFCAEEGRLVRE